jgi:hypothetical protein
MYIEASYDFLDNENFLFQLNIFVVSSHILIVNVQLNEQFFTDLLAIFLRDLRASNKHG